MFAKTWPSKYIVAYTKGAVVQWLATESQQNMVELCIVYFKRYNIYHDTHDAIFNMYQRYILSGFRPKKLDIFTNFTGNWVF